VDEFAWTRDDIEKFRIHVGAFESRDFGPHALWPQAMHADSSNQLSVENTLPTTQALLPAMGRQQSARSILLTPDENRLLLLPQVMACGTRRASVSERYGRKTQLAEELE
jgi:hypothetical protein